MASEFKIIEDTYRDMDKLMFDAHGLVEELSKAHFWLRPYSLVDKKEYRSVVAWVLAGRNPLMSAQLNKFEINYPVLTSAIENGRMSTLASKRIQSAIYNISEINAMLTKLGYTVKTDENRYKLSGMIIECIADIYVFMLLHFDLYKMFETGTVMLSVKDYCDRVGVSPSVMLFSINEFLENNNMTPYGYEPCSKYYQEMSVSYPALLADCEDTSYHLSDEICAELLAGRINETKVRALMTKTMSGGETELDDVNPSNVIRMLKLD